MNERIEFDGSRITDGNAPHNDKFGDAASLDEAIANARTAREQADGKREDVDDEDVVIVADGETLWAIWEKYAKPHGVSWEDFLDSNMHLREPQNLSSHEQAGWQNWSLVHQGDVVFISDTPTAQEATTPTPQETADTYVADIEAIEGQPDSADPQEINAAIDQFETDLSGMSEDEKKIAVLEILSNETIPDEYKQIAVVTYLRMFDHGSPSQIEAAQNLNIMFPDDGVFTYPYRDIIQAATQELGISVELPYDLESGWP